MVTLKNSFSGLVRMKVLLECSKKEEENREKVKSNASFAVGESKETRQRSREGKWYKRDLVFWLES